MKIRTARGYVVSMAVTMIACRSEAPNDKPKAEKPAAPAPIAPAPSVPAEESESSLAARAALKKQAEALVESWSKAQNGGDFASYEKLYAPRFTGIKRAGARTQRFDRAGWMEDRKAMFQKPFSVNVADVHVNASDETAVVEFKQSFTSATFSDSGPKRLVLAREGELKIATEEMLSSSFTGDAKQTNAADPADFGFVAKLSDGPGLVLSRDVDLNAVSGSLRLIDDEAAERDLKTELVAEKWRGYVGKEFALFGEGGEKCKAKVSGFRVLASVIPHFGTRQRWQGEDGAKPTPPGERALALWELSESQGRSLVAKLDAPKCDGASWARASGSPAPRFFTSRAVTADEKKQVKEAARKAPVHREYQALFTKAYGKATPWDETGGDAEVLRAFEDTEGRVYFSATLATGVDDSCASDFDVDLWLLFKKQGDQLELVSARPEENAESLYPRFLSPLAPTMAFDLDGDGLPEFASAHDFIRTGPKGYRLMQNFSPAYFDCPC